MRSAAGSLSLFIYKIENILGNRNFLFRRPLQTLRKKGLRGSQILPKNKIGGAVLVTRGEIFSQTF